MACHIITSSYDMQIRYFYKWPIRFIRLKGESQWYAVIKDFCDALDLRTAAIVQRMPPNMIRKVMVEQLPEASDIVSTEVTYGKGEVISSDVSSRRNGVRHKQVMAATNQIGIYTMLMNSRRAEARQFNIWVMETIDDIRKEKGYGDLDICAFVMHVRSGDNNPSNDLSPDEMTQIGTLIGRRRRQILVHSVIYYKMNENIISDQQWSDWAVELEQLQRDYPDIAEVSPLHEAFKDFEHSSGQTLPLEDPWAVRTAQWLLTIHHNKQEENYDW